MTFNYDCCKKLIIAGLDLLHLLTNSNSYQLRIDLEDWDNNTAFALYRYGKLFACVQKNKLCIFSLNRSS